MGKVDFEVISIGIANVYPRLLKAFDSIVLHDSGSLIHFDPRHRFFHQSVQIAWIVSDRYDANDRCLPGVMVIDLGRGDIKMVGQTSQDRFYNPPLIFQRIDTIEL